MCYVQVLCVETIVSCCVPELPICNVICISQPSTPSSFSHHTLSSSPQHLSRCKSCNLSLRKVPSSSGRDSRVTRGLHHSHPTTPAAAPSCQALPTRWGSAVANVGGRGAGCCLALPLTPNTELFTRVYQFCLVSKDPQTASQ